MEKINGVLYRKADQAPAYITAIVLGTTKKMELFSGLGTRMANQGKAKRQNILGTILSLIYIGLLQRVDPADTDTESNNAFHRWISATR